MDKKCGGSSAIPTAPRSILHSGTGAAAGCKSSSLSHIPLLSGVILLAAAEILWADGHSQSPTWDNVQVIKII